MLIRLLLKLFSFESLQEEFLRRYSEDLTTEEMPQSAYTNLFTEIAQIEGIDDLLKTFLKKDRIRYFNTPPGPAQEQVRGAFLRTLYELNMIRKSRDSKVELTSTFHG